MGRLLIFLNVRAIQAKTEKQKRDFKIRTFHVLLIDIFESALKIFLAMKNENKD